MSAIIAKDGSSQVPNSLKIFDVCNNYVHFDATQTNGYGNAAIGFLVNATGYSSQQSAAIEYTNFYLNLTNSMGYGSGIKLNSPNVEIRNVNSGGFIVSDPSYNLMVMTTLPNYVALNFKTQASNTIVGVISADISSCSVGNNRGSTIRFGHNGTSYNLSSAYLAGDLVVGGGLSFISSEYVKSISGSGTCTYSNGVYTISTTSTFRFILHPMLIGTTLTAYCLGGGGGGPTTGGNGGGGGGAGGMCAATTQYTGLNVVMTLGAGGGGGGVSSNGTVGVNTTITIGNDSVTGYGGAGGSCGYANASAQGGTGGGYYFAPTSSAYHTVTGGNGGTTPTSSYGGSGGGGAGYRDNGHAGTAGGQNAGGAGGVGEGTIITTNVTYSAGSGGNGGTYATGNPTSAGNGGGGGGGCDGREAWNGGDGLCILQFTISKYGNITPTSY